MSTNCENLSAVLFEVKNKKTLLHQYHNNHDYENAFLVKSEITALFESAREFLTVGIFINRVRQREFWKDLGKESLKHFTSVEHAKPKDLEKIFQKMSSLVESLPVPFKIRDSKDYQVFLDQLAADQELRQALMIETHSINEEGLLGMLNSCFIHKYFPENQIAVEHLPENLEDYFGCCLKRGHVKVNRAGTYFGYHMTGGKLEAMEAMSGAGQALAGGTIKINHLIENQPNKSAVYSAGFRMTGGTLYIEQSDQASLCSEMKGGTLVSSRDAGFEAKGNHAILFTEDQNIYDKSPRKYLYWQEEKRYLSGRDLLYSGGYPGANPGGTIGLAPSAKNEKIISNANGLQNFKKEKDLAIITDLSMVGTNVSEGLNGGILVLREVPMHNIGQGMLGGVLIIENSRISIQEAKNCLTKEPHGGVILMREWENPNGTGNSRLIDLERG